MGEGATSLESAIAPGQLPILAEFRFIFGSKAFNDEWSSCLAGFQVGCRGTLIYILFTFEESCIFNYCLLRFIVHGNHCLSVVIYCTTAIYRCTVWLSFIYCVSRLHHESSSRLKCVTRFERWHEFLKLWQRCIDLLWRVIHCLCNMEMVVVHDEMFSLNPSLILWTILCRWSNYGRWLSVVSHLSDRRVKVMMVGSHIRRCCCDLTRSRRSGSKNIMHNELTDGIIGGTWVESWLRWPC